MAIATPLAFNAVPGASVLLAFRTAALETGLTQ
jgi:hypothetical protein